MSTAEYDAFGPWIDQVRTPNDIPRLYRDHPIDLDACRLVLKVPRNISRRDATPAMDLYDQLLIAGPDRLTVLRRQGGAYSESTVPYDRIAVIEDSVSLLDGRLTVHPLAGTPLSVRYNGSQQEVVETLVDLLRELSRAAAPTGREAAPLPEPSPATAAPTPGPAALGDRDVALVSSFRHLLRSEPDVRLLAAQPRLVLAPRDAGALTRALHVARPMTLQGALVCGNGRELQVLSRRDRLVRGNRPVHSIARTVITLARLDAVTSRPDPRYVGLDVLTVHAGAVSLDFPVPADSAAERVLLSLAPAQAPSA